MNIIALVGTWYETDASFVVVLKHGSSDDAPVSGSLETGSNEKSFREKDRSIKRLSILFCLISPLFFSRLFK